MVGAVAQAVSQPLDGQVKLPGVQDVVMFDSALHGRS